MTQELADVLLSWLSNLSPWQGNNFKACESLNNGSQFLLPQLRSCKQYAFWVFVSYLLLCSHENLLGVLCPGLESSAKKKHGPVGDGPEEDDRNDQTNKNLSCEDRLRELGSFRLENTPGRPCCRLSILKESL